jgi:hypothetical protein
MVEADVLRTVEELTPEWLTAALGCGTVASFRAEQIGTGQMSDSHRVDLTYVSDSQAGPASVVLKTASSDETSRATGVNLGVYDREVRFYRELAPRIGGPLADCHVAAIDSNEGWFTLLLEDVAPAVQGDQIEGCGLEQALLAIDELARLHASVFSDPQLGATPWLNQESPLNQSVMEQLLPVFFERYGDRVTPEHRAVCERFVASLDGWLADRRPPAGLVHGDYRLDNLLFGAADAPRRFVAVDWQTVGWGPVMTDAAYFIGGSLLTEDRRTHEEQLLRRYHHALRGHGVRDFSWEQCWAGYRRECFLGLLMVLAPAVIVQRTERGDRMFLAQLDRYAQQVLDLDALEELPAPGTGRPAPLRPEPDDEARHPPGPEELWNESWYFDVVSDDGTVGFYTRLGLYPNLGVSWITGCFCGTDRPTVMLLDYAAPLPAGAELSVGAEALSIELLPEHDLARFTVRMQGAGASYADPAAVLRGEPGEPVPVEVELSWETHGEPYAYRLTTRYEIPCRVSGGVTIGGERIELGGVGQRDHSWGTRDWWSADWMWSAGHLRDGTRFHGVEFRIPGSPPIGAGYLQPPEGGVEEVSGVKATEDAAGDGLVSSARASYGSLELEAQPLAYGPLRLVAPDGRVAWFVRAMCRVGAADGREGLGWFEWNRNQAPTG